MKDRRGGSSTPGDRRRCRLWVRPSREDRRPHVPVRSDRTTRPRSARYRADDIEVDGDGLWKLGSIDHGACLVIGVGAIGVEVEYRTARNAARVRWPNEPARPPNAPPAPRRRPSERLDRHGPDPVAPRRRRCARRRRRPADDPRRDRAPRLRGDAARRRPPGGRGAAGDARGTGPPARRGLRGTARQPDGLGADALAIGRERLRLLVEGDGDVLCVALDGSPDRDAAAGRADSDGTPRLTDAAWQELAEVLHTLADETIAAGRRLAFHPHAGTYVETPAEVDRLVTSTDPARVGICLDVGHYIVGGGDPVLPSSSSASASPTSTSRTSIRPSWRACPRDAGRPGRGGRRTDLHRARRGQPRSPRRPAHPRRARLRRLADGRAGQQLVATVGGRRDRAPGARAGARHGRRWTP